MRKLKQVHPEDFDVKKLLAAARDGRLYVDESRKTVSKEEVIDKVRAYIERIRDFVTPGFRSSVDELWENILACDEFVVFLTPSNKARMCRDFNKYNVMRIIGVLREKGVYEYYNDLQFNARLEKTDKDTPYRKYLSMGFEQRSLLIKIRGFVAKYQL